MNTGDLYRNGAIHEAGHGIAAREFGATRIRLQIDPGRCLYEQAPRCEVFENHLVICTSGHVAELVAAGKDPLAGDRWRTVVGILEREGEPKPNVLTWALGELERELGSPYQAKAAFNQIAESVLVGAWEIVNRRFAEIQHIANQLNRRGEVTL